MCFASWDALRTVWWVKFKSDMTMYVKQHGTAAVPKSYTSPSGHRLGRQLQGVRHSGILWKGHPEEEERVGWLEGLPGWVWNVYDGSWKTFQGEMTKYVDEHGTAAVPKSYTSPSGHRLGPQLEDVRHSGVFWKGHADEEERVGWLEGLPGWVWSIRDDKWKTFQNELALYVNEQCTSQVPHGYVASSGCALGSQLSGVRYNELFLRCKQNNSERIAWLESLPGWTWDVHDKQWIVFKTEMALYVETQKTSHVHWNYISQSGYNLWSRVQGVRSAGHFWKGNRYEEERVAWLESLPDWTWGIHDEQWVKFTSELLSYIRAFGTAKVPAAYVAPSGYKLGSRIHCIRSSRHFLNDKVDEKERVQWLDSLPDWSWRIHDDKWEEFKKELLTHIASGNEAHVSKQYVTPSGYKLGARVGSVRQKGTFWKGRQDQKERVEWLSALPGWMWHVSKDEEIRNRVASRAANKAAKSVDRKRDRS